MRNRILNVVCIVLAGSGLWWTATYFWRYFNYEVTNDAFIDQYVAPLNVRASGYIKEMSCIRALKPRTPTLRCKTPTLPRQRHACGNWNKTITVSSGY